VSERTRYRAAVVGLSGISATPGSKSYPELDGEWPHSHIASYTSLPNVDLVGVCDLKTDLIDQFRANYQTSWPNAHAYTDYREMLEKEKPDLLSVATSDDRHAQIVVDAVAAGVKGILCEKPIATTLADADRMIAAAERAGVVMAVNHTRRWRPVWHAAKTVLASGELGEVRRIVASCGHARAMLFRNGTHLIDSVCGFAGSEPDWVVGLLDEEHLAYGPIYAGQGGRDPAIDPGGSALVHFKSGVRAFINMSKRMFAPLELDIYCETGLLRLRDGSGEIVTPLPGTQTQVSRPLPLPLVRLAETPAAIAEIIRCIEKGGQTLCPPREARKTLAIIIAIIQSSAAGSVPVKFPLVDADVKELAPV